MQAAGTARCGGDLHLGLNRLFGDADENGVADATHLARFRERFSANVFGP
jgi:hypothetical protein